MNMADTIQKNIIHNSGDEPRVIEMKRGIPGFEGVKCYSLRRRDSESPFCILESLGEAGPRFIAVNPFLACPEYEPVIPDREIRLLEIENPSQIFLMVLVTVRRDPLDVTVNLQAPLVINMDRNLAAQVVLEDQDWPFRHSIMPTQSAV